MVGEWLLSGRTHLRLLAPATGSDRQDGLRPSQPAEHPQERSSQELHPRARGPPLRHRGLLPNRELRIAAKISGDTEMLAAYAEGRDLHTLTAQSLTSREEISKDDRKLAKAVNFGLLYGMGAKGLQSYALKSYGIEMSDTEARVYRRRFFETYPRLKRWHEQERRAWRRGDTETRTLTGRQRMDVQRLTDRLNVPVQGAGADGLKLALALLWERRDECPGAVPVLVCRDEVVVECEAERAADAKAWLEKAMIEGMKAVLNGTDEVHVPVEVEARIARSWEEGG
jgi:DNA polymerase I